MQTSDKASSGAFELYLDAEAQSFREEVRTFLSTALPDDIRAWGEIDTVYSEFAPIDVRLRWSKILAEHKGWTCPRLPAEFGGPGLSDVQRYILERELAFAGAPTLPEIGPELVVSALLTAGTAEQRERFFPGILSFDEIWCQGFSEPDAGSDLASLQCRADRDGDEYVLNGTKIWVSYGHFADWMFGLFRSDRSGRKQDGITILFVPMRHPGVTVLPIYTFAGTHILNQVVFDDARVSVSNRLGEENAGWSIVKQVLAVERSTGSAVPRAARSLQKLKTLAADTVRGGVRLIDDPDVGRRVAELEILMHALEVIELRVLLDLDDQRFQSGGPSVLKTMWSEIHSDITALMHELHGYLGQVRLDSVGNGLGLADTSSDLAEATRAAMDAFDARAAPVYGGSNEIQRTIVAKAVLGL